MHYYPPQWHQKTTVDPLTAWERLGNSLVFDIEDWWDGLVENEAQFVWKLTFYTGTAALFLLILLFLESLRVNKIPQLVEKEVEPAPQFVPIVEEKPEPKKAIDPFARFEPIAEPQPSVPVIPNYPAPDFPVQKPTFTPPAAAPELFVDASTTQLKPDYLYSEQPKQQVANSRFRSRQIETNMLADGWKTPLVKDPFDFLLPKSNEPVASWFQSAAAIPAIPIHTKTSSKLTELKNNQSIDGVVLTKRMPERTTKDSLTTYEIIVQNRSNVIQNQIVVEELISNHQCVIDVQPAAKVSGEALQWVIDSLKPGEQKRFAISCILSKEVAVLKTESQLRLAYTKKTETNIFIPDVVVSLTLPVSVERSNEFSVEIEITNNSNRNFKTSDLNLHFIKGVLMKNSKRFSKRIQVPTPGKSIRLPITLTATEAGSGIIEAELDLADTLTVPVKAHTKIHELKDKHQQKNGDFLAKKPAAELVSRNAR